MMSEEKKLIGESVYRVYSSQCGGKYLVFTNRGDHQIWLSLCKSAGCGVMFGVEDENGEVWIYVGDRLN